MSGDREPRDGKRLRPGTDSKPSPEDDGAEAVAHFTAGSTTPSSITSGPKAPGPEAPGPKAPGPGAASDLPGSSVQAGHSDPLFPDAPTRFATGLLERPPGRQGVTHYVYFEELGNPEGIPVVILHGGPGFLFPLEDLGFLSGDKFRVIHVHQRGAGNSLPPGEIRDNETKDLLGDLEAVREHLSLEKWYVMGWSWGSTLGAAYVEQSPDSIIEFIAYAMFLGSHDEDRYHLEHLSRSQPATFEALEGISPNCLERGQAAGFAQFVPFAEEDRPDVNKAIRTWYEIKPDAPISSALRARFRVSVNYFANGFFLKPDQILDEASQAKNVPCTIFHGVRDTVVPVSSARRFADAVSDGKYIALDSTHSIAEEAVQRSLRAFFDARANALDSTFT